MDIAKHGTAQHVETLVRKFQRVERMCERDHEKSQYEAREFAWFYDDGMLLFHQNPPWFWPVGQLKLPERPEPRAGNCSCIFGIQAIHGQNGSGETTMDNLVLLCRHHHRLLHQGGLGIKRTEDHKLSFFNSSGNKIEQSLYPQFENSETKNSHSLVVEVEHQELGLDIDSGMAETAWLGDKLAGQPVWTASVAL